jgi:hypothetical protein
VAYVCNLACHAPSVTHFSLLLLLRLSSSLQLATRKTQAKLYHFPRTNDLKNENSVSAAALRNEEAVASK